MTRAREVGGMSVAARRLLVLAGAVAGLWLVSWLLSGHADAATRGANPIGDVVGVVGNVLGGGPAPDANHAAKSAEADALPPKPVAADVLAPVTDVVASAVSQVSHGVRSAAPASPVARPATPVVDPISQVVSAAAPVAQVVRAAAPVIDPVSQVVRSTAPAVEPVSQVVEAVTSPVTKTVAGIVQPIVASATKPVSAVAGLVSPLTGTVAGVVAPVGDLVRPVTANLLKPVLGAASPILDDLLTPVADLTKPVLGLVAPVVGDVVRPITAPVADAVGPPVLAPISEPVHSTSGAAKLPKPLREATPAAVPSQTAEPARLIARDPVPNRTVELRQGYYGPTSARQPAAEAQMQAARQPAGTPGKRRVPWLPAPSDAACGIGTTIPPASLTPDHSSRATSTFTRSHGDFVPLSRPCKPGTGPG